MGNVRRVYVEKKKDYAVKAKELLEELRQYLGLSIDDLRILIRYDIEDLSDESYQKALGTVSVNLRLMKSMRRNFQKQKMKYPSV